MDTELDTQSLNPIANKPVAEKFEEIEEEISNIDGIVHKQQPTFPDPELFKLGDEWLHPETLAKYKVYDNDGDKIWVEVGTGHRNTQDPRIIKSRHIDGDSPIEAFTLTQNDIGKRITFDIVTDEDFIVPSSLMNEDDWFYVYIINEGVPILKDEHDELIDEDVNFTGRKFVYIQKDEFGTYIIL